MPMGVQGSSPAGVWGVPKYSFSSLLPPEAAREMMGEVKGRLPLGTPLNIMPMGVQGASPAGVQGVSP
jgi:hypothetical protein